MSDIVQLWGYAQRPESGYLITPTFQVAHFGRDETRVTDYKRYVPPGVVPLATSVVAAGMSFLATTAAPLQTTFSGEFAAWIEDENGVEIFRLAAQFEGQGEQINGVDTHPFAPVVTGSANQGPVRYLIGGYSPDGANEGTPAMRVSSGGNGAGFTFQVQIDTGAYRVDVPYGARWFHTSRFHAVSPGQPGEERTDFPVGLIQNCVPALGGVRFEGGASAGSPYAQIGGQGAGVSAVNAGAPVVKQVVYVRDGAEFSSYQNTQSAAQVSNATALHRIQSAQPVSACVLWQEPLGGSFLLWREETFRRAPAFTRCGPIYENMAAVPGAGVFGQHVANAWIALQGRPLAARMGGVLTAPDARILWVEQAAIGEPWKLLAMQPRAGGSMEELGDVWTDPDVIYLHVIDTPDGGAAALAVYEKITPTVGAGGSFTFPATRKWLFKRSPDRETWPGDEEAIEVAVTALGAEGVRPATLVWREGTLLASNHFSLKYVSRRGGAAGSWQSI